MIGGRGSENIPLKSVSRYNLLRDLWDTGIPSMNIARAGASACSLGDGVYVFGGFAGGKPLNSVERFLITAHQSRRPGWLLI